MASANGKMAATAAIGILVTLAATSIRAFPDDTPWGRAPMEACQDCHTFFDPVRDSGAIRLEGLPEKIEAARAYPLELELSDEAMLRAGFRIIASAGGSPAGQFEASDERTEADGDRLRSTATGSELEQAGYTQWSFIWQAPPQLPEAPIEFEVSANASDDDASPLGDIIHLKTFNLPGR